MERKQLDKAWNSARGGREIPNLNIPIVFDPQRIADWRRIDMSPVREAIAERILREQVLPTYPEYYPGCLFPAPPPPSRWERVCAYLADLFCVHNII